jgi:hypothetical protein
MLVTFQTSKSMNDESKYEKCNTQIIQFNRQVSVSFIDSIPKQYDDFMCFEESENFSLSSLSSSEASNLSSLDLLDKKAIFESSNDAHQTDIIDQNKHFKHNTTFDEHNKANIIQVRTKKDLNELREKYKVYSKKDSKKKRNNKKLKKGERNTNKDMTSELCTYKVRRSSSDLFNFFILNEPEDFQGEPYDEEACMTHTKTDSNNYVSHSVKIYIQNMDIGHDCDMLNYDSRKSKQLNKKLKLKKLVKNGDVLSLVKENAKSSLDDLVKLNKNSVRKGECNLHVKYNVYKKINDYLSNSYISTIQRCSHVYKSSSKHVSLENFNLIKANFRANKKLDRLERLAGIHNAGSQDIAFVDPTTVVNNSLDHQNVNLLNQVYDDLYVEFLISIQHREITPEDYEYLSRLDELIKKKTVNDILLNKFKKELVSEEIFQRLQGEACGICLESYTLNTYIKHLPCKHIFHSDCIDEWLKNQSHCCPLDNLSVEYSESQINEPLSVQNVNDSAPSIEVESLLQEMIEMVEQSNA